MGKITLKNDVRIHTFGTSTSLYTGQIPTVKWILIIRVSMLAERTSPWFWVEHAVHIQITEALLTSRQFSLRNIRRLDMRPTVYPDLKLNSWIKRMNSNAPGDWTLVFYSSYKWQLIGTKTVMRKNSRWKQQTRILLRWLHFRPFVASTTRLVCESTVGEKRNDCVLRRILSESRQYNELKRYSFRYTSLQHRTKRRML